MGADTVSYPLAATDDVAHAGNATPVTPVPVDVSTAEEEVANAEATGRTGATVGDELRAAKLTCPLGTGSSTTATVPTTACTMVTIALTVRGDVHTCRYTIVIVATTATAAFSVVLTTRYAVIVITPLHPGTRIIVAATRYT